MKKLITILIFGFLNSWLYADTVDIPGLIESRYQGEVAYTNTQGEYYLLASALDMGGSNPGLGQDLPIASVRKNIANKLNGTYPDKILKTPLTGIYELFYGEQVFYIDGTGRYIFKNGRLLSRKGENLSTDAYTKARELKAQQTLQLVSQIADSEMLVYPASKEQSWITVFTDVDCPYCSRIHSELDTYKKAGITVKYLFFPQAGEQSSAYSTFINVWCSQDPYTALEKAEAGQYISKIAVCQHPVDKHLALARQLGLTATPVIVMPDGTLIYGYKRPLEIIKLANLHNNRI